MVSGVARSLLGVAGWARGQAAVQAGGLMNFAPEPVLDAITPPTRQAQRAPAQDDNGQSFDDHLDAVSEPPRERPAPARNEATDERAPASETTPADETQTADEPIDPDVALLGGPPPQAAPPPMAAPVVVQIAASQPQQQQAPQSTDAEAAPAIPPQAPVAPESEPAMAAAAQPVAQSAPVAGKHGQAEVKPSAPTDAPQAPAQPQSAQTTQEQAQQIPSTNTAAEVETLPQPVRDAIAATIVPAPQTAVQRMTRATQQTAETDAATPKDGKAEAPAPAINAKTQAPRTTAGGAGNLTIDPAAVTPQAPGSAPDSSQIAQSNAITTTASQASTHVQHAAIDSGAQRAAPAAAQVGREIIRRFDGGNTSFELRLDPAELGRVEVRMEVTRDHRVTAVITADNPQALTELARNARELEQQLQSAGLQLSDNGLSFDLRQGGHGGETDEASTGARGAGGEEALTEQQQAPVARPIGYERWRGMRVDMMV